MVNTNTELVSDNVNKYSLLVTRQPYLMLSYDAATFAIQLRQFISSEFYLAIVTADLVLHATTATRKTIFCSRWSCCVTNKSRHT